jgi:UDP-glucose 4-epimerase
VAEVVAAVERVSGRRILTVKAPRRAGDPPVLIADARRAEALLGWRPRHSDLDTIVESAVRWHASQASARGERTAAGPLRAA